MLKLSKVKKYLQAIVNDDRDYIEDFVGCELEHMADISEGFAALWDSKETIYTIDSDEEEDNVFIAELESGVYKLEFDDYDILRSLEECDED